MCLQCRPIKCADLHLLGCSREGMLWKEGVGVHPTITELPLHKGSSDKIPITMGRGIYSLVAILMLKLQMELGSSSDDDDPIPAGCPSHVTGIPGGTAGVGWCDAMVALCLVPREVLGCSPPPALLFRSGAQHQLSPDISIS